jgi:hypothetical protein
MFIAALFIIDKLWKQKLIYVLRKCDMHEYYSVIKKKEILSFTGKWMKL